MTSFLLTLPAPFRHLLVLLFGVLASWGGAEFVPFLNNQSSLLGALSAALVSAVLAYATPLVASYGVGSAEARELGARQPRSVL